MEANIATYENIFEKTGTKPVIITGASGSGKTTATKNILARINPNPVFVVDVSDEYDGYEKVGLGKILGTTQFEKNTHVRFVPHADSRICAAQCEAVFQHINLIKTSGNLQNLIVVVEEAHRFEKSENLMALAIEARKFLRKLIIVTTNWKPYRDIAQIFRPPPWQFQKEVKK